MNKVLIGYKILRFVCQKTPLFIANPSLKGLAWLYYKFDTKNGAHVEKNLRILGKAKAQDISGLAYKVYYHFACFLFEFFSMMQAKVNNEKEFKAGIEKLLGAPGERSSLIVVAHQGNWELSLRKLMSYGYPVTTIAMQHSNKEVDSFFGELRENPLLDCFYLKEGLAPCKEAVKKKRIIALACERDYTRRGVEVEVAGAKVKFPVGPAYLFNSFNLPVFMGYSERQSLGYFKKELYPLELSPDLRGKEDSVKLLTQEIANQVFKKILISPEQWITFDDYFFLEK